MSEISRGEMLATINVEIEDAKQNYKEDVEEWGKESWQAETSAEELETWNAIRDLVENRPRVSREILVEALRGMPIYDTEDRVNHVIKMFREAGVEIEGECDKSSTLINKCKAIDTKGRP